MITLTTLSHIPERLLHIDATELHEVLPGPTLIHLPGKNSSPLFVSVLQHGNEITGFNAIQSLLIDYQNKTLPRALSIFIGNVDAASKGVRRHYNQPDYNRCWQPGDTPEHAIMMQVIDAMQKYSVFASIDLHNTTGSNPHYACINQLDTPFQQLASLFSRTVVYFTLPQGVQSMAFAKFCPSVTLECGQPGQTYGANHAKEYINSCLHLSQIPKHTVATHDINLFHTVATIKVPELTTFSIGKSKRDICFIDQLDHYNFCELPTNTLFGHYQTQGGRLDIRDEQNKQIAGRYFNYSHGEIRSRRPVMPSMLTLNETIIRQDCLGYLMERMPSS